MKINLIPVFKQKKSKDRRNQFVFVKYYVFPVVDLMCQRKKLNHLVQSNNVFCLILTNTEK